MRARAAFVVGFAGFVLVACGGGGGSPSTYQDPKSEANPTDPSSPSAPAAETNGAATGEKGDEQGPPSILTASPSCATAGARVVLKLGLTRDHRTPNCFKVDDARVEFAPGKHAKITLIGPMSDGYCALDVEVPEGAESGKVKVEIGNDDFESDAAFGVPCP